MDKTNKDNQQPDENSSKKRLIIFAVLFVILIGAGLYLKQKFEHQETTADASQESFQGPAELSTAVQQDCQQTAKEILSEVDCKIKSEKFLNSINSCQTASYSMETEEGNFADLSIKIAACFFEKMNDRSAAVDILNKTQSVIPEWEVFQGPISCPSKPILSALKESYAESKKFTCIKSADISQIVSKVQSKDFAWLSELVKPGSLIQQGFIDSDASCPDTMATVQEILGKMTKNGFTVKEQIDENPAAEKAAERYLEFYNSSKKLLNLHFRVDSDDCLNFVSLLAESTDTAE